MEAVPKFEGQSWFQTVAKEVGDLRAEQDKKDSSHSEEAAIGECVVAVVIVLAAGVLLEHEHQGRSEEDNHREGHEHSEIAERFEEEGSHDDSQRDSTETPQEPDRLCETDLVRVELGNEGDHGSEND